MVRIVSTDDLDRSPAKTGPAVVVTLGDLDSLGLGTHWGRGWERAGEVAMATWGFIGVGVRTETSWAGVILVTPDQGLPKTHPLALGGVEPTVAAMIWSQIGPGLSAVHIGKRLVTGLNRGLRSQVGGIEALGTPGPLAATPLAPSAQWLVRMGFRQRRGTHRYRLDFAGLAAVVERLYLTYRPAIALTPQPAPATLVTGNRLLEAAE
jgi:hypothetical protein